jgi:glycosyltransferase involved in cell wall biosynthesis
MAALPEVAVVVGAYGRREYLPAAIDSVLAQTFPRSAYEIVVITDLELGDLRSRLDSADVTVVHDTEPRIGGWLAHAARRTTAPLVAFLDDDDEFEPDRLAKAVEVFRAHPEVGFYRNRVRVIDAAGRPIPRERWRTHERDARFDRTGPVAVGPSAGAAVVPLLADDAFVSFNSSTMIVRRELLAGDGGPTFESSQLPDLALAVIAALSPYALYLDDRRLTRFRFYRASVTHRVAWLRDAAESHAGLAAFARARGEDALARWLADRAVHYDRIHRGEAVLEGVLRAASRRDVATGALDYLRFLGHHASERSARLDLWSAPLYAGSYLVFPGLTRRLAVVRAAVLRD